MINESPKNLLAVDIGNSRMKLGWYSAETKTSIKLPTPDKFLELYGKADVQPLNRWINALQPAIESCLIASVHRTTSQWLINQLAACGLAESAIHELHHSDLPLSIHTDHPDRVGIDRLLNAVAANHLRQTNTPAIIVDMGTAITVDLVAADGAFEGGAILPGYHLSARALQAGTDILPLVELEAKASSGQSAVRRQATAASCRLPPADSFPNALGKSTEAAIAAGLHWGAIGAVRELISQLSMSCEHPRPDLFITGGDADKFSGSGGPWAVDKGFAADCRLPTAHYPHMVLAGIWITGQELL